jgi:hypothetical protein
MFFFIFITNKSLENEDKCDLSLAVCFVQEDIFQSIGVPLVKNALAGYNTSILSYGQVLFDV